VTPEQRTKAVDYLSEGATFSEAWAMVGASRRDAEREWIEGKRDSENGIESELAAFYVEAAAARARIRATLRAEAREFAGSREATDRLQVLAALQEEEPSAELAADDDARASSPLLAITDRIADPRTPEDERKRLSGMLEEASTAMHALFVEITKPKEVAAR
jgi:hypothetical protein